MPEPVIAMLIGASLATMIGYLCWSERQHRDRRRRKVDEAEVYCVWCLYRRGDMCTHPGSPVYPGECTPVCVGRMGCEARVVRPWGSGS
jgi:hypothetical protein